MANERIPLSLLMNVSKPFPEFSPSGSKTISKMAPLSGQENGDAPSAPKRGPARRYTIQELRSLNKPELLDLAVDEWPGADDLEDVDLDDSFFATPAKPIRSHFVPNTAPARMRASEGPETPPSSATRRTPRTQETDSRRLGQRAKQIAFGKATLGYRLAKLDTAQTVRTPREDQKCSKRCWDAQVREWRVRLHAYDPQNEQDWRKAMNLFPAECLALASTVAAGKAPPGQVSPPEDIAAEAAKLVASATSSAPARVNRALNMDGDDNEDDDDNDKANDNEK